MPQYPSIAPPVITDPFGVDASFGCDPETGIHITLTDPQGVTVTFRPTAIVAAGVGAALARWGEQCVPMERGSGT